MAQRLGLGLIPGTGWRAGEIQDIARSAEDAGFEAVFAPRSTSTQSPRRS